MSYQEHEKLAAVAEQSQGIGEFLEWLGGQGIFLAQVDSRPRFGSGHVLVAETADQILARYFNIDLKKVEKEKRQMLVEIAKANEGRP